MSRTLKTINFIAFFSWISLISFLLYKNYTGIPLDMVPALEKSFSKATYWYDIYTGSKKIGFASTSFEKVGNEIIIKHEREMKNKKGEEERLLIEKLKCLSDLYYSIKSFEYTSNLKDEKGLKIRGEVDNENIIFFIESPEKRKTYKISRNGKDFYLPITLIPAIHQKNPTPKTTFLIPMLNLLSLSIDDVRVVLDEIRPLKVSLNILSLYKFKIGDSILWSNEKSIIKEEYPSGIIFYSQVETFAKDPVDRIPFDYTSLPFFKSNKLITNAEKLTFLKVKIKGFRLEPKLYENSIVTLKTDILTIEKKDLNYIKEKTYILPYTGNKLKEYLNPDNWVLSNYKPLLDTGRIYARSHNNDAFRLTNYLNGYLFRLVGARPMFVLQNSKDFLDSLSGDYLERTVMFASYARAAGLPTRLVGGLVYINGYFYFHTWPEVWFDKWIPVDPTLSQFPADVTHIPLKEGSLKDIVSIVDELRNIQIEIIEMKESEAV